MRSTSAHAGSETNSTSTVPILASARHSSNVHWPAPVSGDDAPALDPDRYPMHPRDRAKPRWRRALRLQIDLWRARHADLLIPFSPWAGRILVEGAGVPASRVHPVHVGLDLDLWRPSD